MEGSLFTNIGCTLTGGIARVCATWRIFMHFCAVWHFSVRFCTFVLSNMACKKENVELRNYLQEHAFMHSPPLITPPFACPDLLQQV